MEANEKCCVCSRQDRSCCIEEVDENGIDYKNKLKLIVPEIDWNLSHCLCGKCLHYLNVAYIFKQLCLDKLLVVSEKSVGIDGTDKGDHYFPIHNDMQESTSDSEEDKTTVLESHILPNFDNDEYTTNVVDIPNRLKNERRTDREILSQIHPPENTNITFNKNQFTRKSISINCKSCKETFQRKYDLIKHERTHCNKHFCNVCQKSYKRKLHLEQHIIIKHTEKNNWKHQCCYCDDVFPTKILLILHSKRQHKTNETLICFYCNKNFVDKNILLDHIILEHQQSKRLLGSNNVAKSCDDVDGIHTMPDGLCNIGTFISTLSQKSDKICLVESSNKTEVTKKQTTRTFSCATCPAVFPSSVKLVHHCVNEHKTDAKLVRPFACDLCDKRFSTSAILIEHRRYHLKNRQNICSFCGKGFITKNDLNCHEYIHLNERSFKCEVCLKGFNTQKNLRTHKIVKHADPMTWKHCCTICNKRFAILSNYKVHVRRHMGDKQFSCHLCDKKFVNKDELRQHTESHSNIREFQCQYCDKEYKKKRVYEIHLTKNHGIGNAKIPKREKKHTCQLCPKSYFDKSKLNKHLLSHSGIKPFVCSMCDKKFTDNYYLKQHMKNCHRDVIGTATSDCTG